MSSYLVYFICFAFNEYNYVALKLYCAIDFICSYIKYVDKIFKYVSRSLNYMYSNYSKALIIDLIL